MKALVTGGAGFIGSNLVTFLLGRGDQVVVLDDLSSGYLANAQANPDAELVRGDVRDKDLVARACASVEVVYHLAASVGNKRSIDFPSLDSDINVLGTLSVLEGARHAGVRKVVVSSSAGTFGELRSLPIREDHPMEPETPYGASKLCAEKHALAYAKLYDLEAICLRYFNVYGPRQRFDAYGNVIPIFAFKMLRGEPITVFGDGEQTRDFVNVADVVQANVKAGDQRGASAPLNIGSGTQISINHLLSLMHEASGIKPVIQHAPPRAGDVRDSLADISAARKLIGFAPEVTMLAGLVKYFEWAKSLPA